MSSAFGPQSQGSAVTSPTQPFMGGRKPLNIVIVGGSHAGLFIAVLLKRQGHNVRVLERATSSARSGLAAGIGLAAWVKRFFDDNDRLKEIPFGVLNDFLNVLDKDMNTKQQIPLSYRMTTWDATYYRLRANFDGFESSYCRQPPAMDRSGGQGVYETGRSVLRVEEGDDGLLSVLVEDVTTGEQHKYEADAVVAADGANSTIRKQFHPYIRREEPGYVLWRGTVPTRGLSKEILDKLDGKSTLFPMPYSYTIIYSIPGENGSLAAGERHINFAWYTWPSSSCLTVKDILTDKDGHVHHTTLPKGGMRPEIWSRQLQHAQKTLPPLLYELASKITDPFVSVVSTIHAPQASYLNHRLFLIGDALTQLQPNTGQGTNFAAMDAMLLANVFSGEMSPQEWETRVLEASRREQVRAVAFASVRLCGWWGQGVAQLRWRWVVLWQDICGWWLGERAKL